MKKILALAGSNHSNSIHHQLVGIIANSISEQEVTILDVRKWVVPMYSIDMDPDQTPEQISELISLIENHDGFIFASPEHNGGPSAFFKNILDWLSRRAKKVFDSKPMFLVSTSPGGGGGATHLNHLEKVLPYQGADVVSKFSLPSFNENVKDGKLADVQMVLLREKLESFMS